MHQIEQRGDSDCLRACLASILDLEYEDVPEEIAQAENQHKAMVRFLKSRGISAWLFSIWGAERPYLKFGNNEIRYSFYPPGLWIASVLSPRNDDWHCVVMRGGKIVWDPHPLRGIGHRGFVEAMILMPIGI